MLNSGVKELGQGGGRVPDAPLTIGHQDHLLGVVAAERDAVVAVAPDSAAADHDVNLSAVEWCIQYNKYWTFNK